MIKKILHFFHYVLNRRFLYTEAPEKAIEKIGHRDYVGGKWSEIGAFQLELMKARGLRPHHVFLDIACGSLRGGVYFIPYLEKGHYLGVEKEKALVEAGLQKELSPSLLSQKAPEIIVSDSFEFSKLSKKPDFALAHALFTHLVPEAIELCLRNLRACAAPGCRFYATFFETSSSVANPGTSQDHTLFYYTREQMAEFGRKTGWQSLYIGDIKHPRKQVMMEYRAGS